MDVQQIPCTHCGVVNEIISRRTFGDYNPLCESCGIAVREVRKRAPVSNRGSLYLGESNGRGLGVFTSRPVREDAVVERCPAFVMDAGEKPIAKALEGVHWYPFADRSLSQPATHMCFPWIKTEVKCIPLGYAMLYNHEPTHKANVSWTAYIDPDTNRRYIDFFALRDIVRGEELSWTYETPDELWFMYKPGGGGA